MTDTHQEATAAKSIAASPADHARTNATTAITAASKTDVVLKKLRSAKGVSIEQLTGSLIRSFLSATVRKKLGLNLVSAIGKDEIRCQSARKHVRNGMLSPVAAGNATRGCP